MFIRKRIKPPAFAEVNEARITDTYESGVIASTPFGKKPKYRNYFTKIIVPTVSWLKICGLIF
jgi:hypothetical protein